MLMNRKMPMILSLLDKIDSRLENTNNANLIKYFFESTITQTIYFKYNSRHALKVNLYYKTLEIDIGNYNSLLDSLNAFFQDEILNNDNIVECYKFIKKYPCIKNI